MRYARLLEGLDISEVRLSQLEFSGRLDSEYYRPSHIGLEKLIFARDGVPLSTLCDFVIGPFGSAFTVENYSDNQTYRYIRGKDVKPMRLVESDNVFMPKADFDRLSKYALRAGDILVSVVGTLGNSALIEKKHLPAIFSCKNTALRTRGIDPRYLITYLNCEYGSSLLVRKERGAVQKGLNLDDLKTLCVYVASTSLQRAISEIHISAATENKKAKEHLSKAETTLLRALGLENWKASEPLSYIRRSRDVFGAERLDPEYFQRKYDEYVLAVRNYAFGVTTIGEQFDLINDIADRKKNAYNYIEIGDINVADGTASYNLVSTEKLPANAKHEVKFGDMLISKVRPNRGEVAIINNDLTDLIVSGAFTVLRQKSMSTFSCETLKVLLRTPMYRDWMLKFNVGTHYPVIRDEDILHLPIPMLESALQEEIATVARKSALLKLQSNHCLDAARRAVEIAIEQDEKAAFAYLESNT